jgi:light-harvesting protein B-800-850 alpha chain
MNQAKIWLIVKPSVGLPLMLIAVAITALLVHYAVLSHSTWYPAFLQGGKVKAADLLMSVPWSAVLPV